MSPSNKSLELALITVLTGEKVEVERIDESWTDEPQEQEPTATDINQPINQSEEFFERTTTAETHLTALVLTVPSVGHFCTTLS